MFLVCLLVFTAWYVTGEGWLFLAGVMLIYPACEDISNRVKEGRD